MNNTNINADQTLEQDRQVLFADNDGADSLLITAVLQKDNVLRIRQENSGQLTKECFSVTHYCADLIVQYADECPVALALGVTLDNLMIALGLHFSSRHALEDFGDFCRLNGIAYTFETSDLAEGAAAYGSQMQ